MSNTTKRLDVLGQVRNPLIFFALALLVIEGIIGFVVARSEMTSEYVFGSVCLMALLFLVVVGAVIWITIKWPENLYEDVIRDIQLGKRADEFVSTGAFRDAVELVVKSRVKPDCLMEPRDKGLET